LALLVLAQNIAVQSGFLDPPAAADLNGPNLSALYEIVDSRERNPQVLSRLFFSSGALHNADPNAIFSPVARWKAKLAYAEVGLALPDKICTELCNALAGVSRQNGVKRLFIVLCARLLLAVLFYVRHYVF
jgi:hypothetical protein